MTIKIKTCGPDFIEFYSSESVREMYAKEGRMGDAKAIVRAITQMNLAEYRLWEKVRRNESPVGSID